MFDHAKDFYIDNAQFNDNRGGTIRGSGNTHNNNYNNSFNDNSRREYITHHDTTHHHGPVHNIEKAGNVNLGTNYGHLDMNQHEEPGEFSRDSSPEREDQAHFREDVPRQAQGYPSHGYPTQDSRSFSQGYYDPNPPPRTAPVGPPPGHRDGIRRAQTNPPPAHWGNKNPFIPYLDSVNDDQPPRPPFRSAPATHQPPVYDRMPTGYESYRNEQDERSRAHARDTQREYSARVDDRDRTSRRDTSHFPQPHNRAPSPARRATTHHDYDHRGQGHSQSRSKKMHRRPPSPAYSDSSDSEKHTYNNGDGRRGTRKQVAETRQFDRAMDHVNRMADRMSRMKF